MSSFNFKYSYIVIYLIWGHQIKYSMRYTYTYLNQLLVVYLKCNCDGVSHIFMSLICQAWHNLGLEFSCFESKLKYYFPSFFIFQTYPFSRFGLRIMPMNKMALLSIYRINFQWFWSLILNCKYTTMVNIFIVWIPGNSFKQLNTARNQKCKDY